jgi:hypothetical protein
MDKVWNKYYMRYLLHNKLHHSCWNSPEIYLQCGDVVVREEDLMYGRMGATYEM